MPKIIRDDEGEPVEIYESCGNVFADMGLPDAEEALAKAEVSIRIEDLMDERGLSHSQAAALLGMEESDVSHIVEGRLRNYTLDRLFQCLTALDQDVEIVIRPRQDAGRPARVLVAH